jgi:hypothetical protein
VIERVDVLVGEDDAAVLETVMEGFNVPVEVRVRSREADIRLSDNE